MRGRKRIHDSLTLSHGNFIFTCLFSILSADENIPAKILSYNRANRAVAILCNHQRAPPKTFEKSMMNLQTKVTGCFTFIYKPNYFDSLCSLISCSWTLTAPVKFVSGTSGMKILFVLITESSSEGNFEFFQSFLFPSKQSAVCLFHMHIRLHHICGRLPTKPEEISKSGRRTFSDVML